MSIDTSKLKRYKPGYVHSNDGPGYISMIARDDGEYVRLEDVKAITSALEQALTQQRGDALAAASVSERAREIVPVGPDGGWCTRCGCGNDAANFAHLPSCNAKTPDAAARAREILIGLNQGFIGCKRDNEIITKGNAYDVFVRGDTALRAIEQALTQQWGECEICHGTGEGGGVDGDCALCGGKPTTPQPSADAVREYVTELRAQADQKMGVAGACAHDGDRARYKSAAQLLRRVADELESLLSAASGEGVDDTKRLDWIARQGGYEFDFGILNDQPGDGDWFVHGMGGSGQGATFRDAIDAAIKEEAGGQDANTDILDTLAFKTENGDAGRGSVTYIALVASGEADHQQNAAQGGGEK